MKKTTDKPNILINILFSLILLYIFLYLFKYAKKNQSIEAFTQKKKFLIKDNNTIFDDFYCDVYNTLLRDENKDQYEIDEIKKMTNLNDNTKILDIGSGNGHHVNLLQNVGAKILGLDKSHHMTDRARKAYPKCKFKTGDFMNPSILKNKKYDHIVCLYFTIYYIENKSKFFKKCFKLLNSSGYLFLHLVNREKFDPMVSVSNPLYIVSPQSVTDKRITKSSVKFENFQYKSNFKLKKNDNIGIFDETITDDKTKKVRKNIHTLFMEPQQEIIEKAMKEGFILKGKIDLTPIQYEYQYLYVLYKS